MPRPAKKKTRVLAKAAREGELKAEAEDKAKIFSNAKQRTAWLIEQAEKVLDKIDPLKVAAIMGLTYFVKQGIEWTELPLSQMWDKDSLLRGLLRVIPGWGLGEGLFAPWANIPEDVMQKALDQPSVEILEWLLSFVVAYIIVEHAGELIQAGSNLLFAAKGLIGGLLAG